MKVKRIGILLESTESNKHLYETVRALAESGEAELFLLKYRKEEPKGLSGHLRSRLRFRRLWRAIELAFFHFIIGMEFKLLSVAYPKIREHYETRRLDSLSRNEVVELAPTFSNSGLVVQLAEADIQTLKALNLDLIVRDNALGCSQGGIITAAKDGMLSLHHGDNRRNRGGPAAFWEVYQREPSTGFVIQILTGELGGGVVLFRGNVPTRRSYTQNLVNLFEASFPYLTSILLEYAHSGRLPKCEIPVPYGGRVLLDPNLAQSVSYAARTTWLFVKFLTKRWILKQYKRWNVAFEPKNWDSAILCRGMTIQNPPGHFFADPFLASRDGRTVCFVEDYSFSTKRARISAVEILDDRTYEFLGPVLEEPFHMSFPFLFEHEGSLFMIPETSEASAIRLYRCVEFPLKWEYQKELMANKRAADTMLFELEGRWWMLTNVASPGSLDFCSQLCAFYATDPFSCEWSPHQQNPIVFDSAIARNAGLLRLADGTLVRCRQRQGFDQYGEGFSLARITELTPASFREEEIAKITPEFFPKLQGCHHLSSNGEYTVFDFARTDNLK